MIPPKSPIMPSEFVGIQEGKVKKGGINSFPSIPRPEPPKPQYPKIVEDYVTTGFSGTMEKLSNPTIKMFRADKNAIIPKYATEGSHGLDLVSVETLKIAPYDRVTVRTGIHMELPEGCAGFVCPRSGMAAKHGITVLNAPGIIDQDFIGEIKVILYNSSGSVFLVEEGMKIAQLVIMFAPKIEIFEVNSFKELKRTNRGENGFGSTGK